MALPFDIANNAPFTVQTIPSTAWNDSSAPSNVVKQKQNQTSSGDAALVFPVKDHNLMQFGTLFKFISYSYNNQATNAQFITSISGASVSLPLPRELGNSLNLSYSDIGSGVLGFAVKAGAGLAGKLTDALKGNSDFSNSISNGAALGAGAKDLTSVAMAAAMKTAGEALPGASQQISQLTGLVANPFNVATFKQPQARAYNLTFNLIPQSQEDSDAIQNIINAFYWHSLPQKVKSGAASGSIANQSIFWQMPDEVEIEFYGTNKLFSFARSVITSVSVNYAAGGQASFFNDGAPTAVILSLGIRELQQLDQGSFSPTQAAAIATMTPSAAANNSLTEASTLQSTTANGS